MKRWPDYIIINLILFLMGLLFFFYFTLPGSMQLPCLIREATGFACVSCGFTRAFEAFLQLDLEIGNRFNELALPVFLFLAGQVLLRIMMVALYYALRPDLKPTLIKVDALTSISLFLLAFLPVLISI